MSEAAGLAALIAARPLLRRHPSDGLLANGAPLVAIAAELGTPCWVLGLDTVRARIAALRRAMPSIAIHYAVKANDTLALLGEVARQGLGADIVSAGELARARRAGIPPASIVFSGAGKTDAELAAALDAGIAQINVESASELDALSRIATATNRTARVALRVNPGIDAETHDKISTGRAGDKFGIPAADIPATYRHAAALPGIVPAGLAVHIGSQIASLRPYRAAWSGVAALARDLLNAGLPLDTIDAGGGLAIPYDTEITPAPEAWAGALHHAFAGLPVTLAIEPGRFLAAPAGLLLATIIRARDTTLILDAGMTDLLRPALYGARHAILPIAPAALAAPTTSPHTVFGPVCESADRFGLHPLPPLREGDPVAILDTGAYGSTMSTRFNARPLAPIVLAEGGTWRIARRRETVEAGWREELP